MQEIIFRVAQRKDYQYLSRWIVEVSQSPEQHCLHSWASESADELCQQLLGYLDDSELCYILAFQHDNIVGAMGSEYDEELGRAWLHGPHAITENWTTIASGLFTRVLQELSDAITDLNAYLNIENIRGDEFYTQQGFKEKDYRSHEYWLLPADRVALREIPCEVLEKQHEASFVKLFHAIFPMAYYSGERILKMIGASHQVFVAVEKNAVAGFVVVSIDESSITGEVQFLGVREDQRGQGYGKQLLLSATNWLLDKANVSKIALNVADDLANARGLYESVGFTLKFTGLGLRKTLETR